MGIVLHFVAARNVLWNGIYRLWFSREVFGLWKIVEFKS